MENQTPFDLDSAIADFQKELVARADLNPTMQSGMETELRDSLVGLQKLGLNKEESFWLARRRLGQTQWVAKLNQEQVWRERTLWIVIGLLAVNLWAAFLNQFVAFNHESMRQQMYYSLEGVLPGWLLNYLPGWVTENGAYESLVFVVQLGHLLPVLMLAVLIARGGLKYAGRALSFILKSRVRFLIAMSIVFAIVHSIDLFYSDIVGLFYSERIRVFSLLFQFLWAFSLIALATWLIPSKKESTAQGK